MKFIKSLSLSLFSVLLGIGGGILLAAVLGESPLVILRGLFLGSFGSWQAFSQSLANATPLIFTGLAVCVAYRGGLFNIGAQGQWLVGAIVLVLVGSRAPLLPAYLALPLAWLACCVGGASFAFIAGWLKARRGSHEVLVTIMSNFIAFGLYRFLISGILRNPNAETSDSIALSSAYHLPSSSIFPSTSLDPLNLSFILAIALVILTWVLLENTTFGYEIRMMGESKETAERSGVPVSKRIIQLMTLSGAIAGMVALHEVLGVDHALKQDVAEEYGFLGIGVALLGRGHPIGVFFAALLFGFLKQSGSAIQVTSRLITKDLAMIMQAFILLSVVSSQALENRTALISWFRSFLQRRKR